MPTIHGVNLSPFVRKTRAIFEEKGLDYELNPVLPFQQDEAFQQISPLRKIPVYQDGEFTLPDSSCIALYIERKHPAPALFPEQDEDFGRALFYEEYADTRVVEVLAVPFVQRVVNQRLMKIDSDEALVTEVLETRVPPVFDWLEEQVPEGEGIVGNRFSIADIAIAAPFVNFMHAGEGVDAQRWPRLAAYIERIHRRPSFEKLIAEEKAVLAAA